MGILHAKWWLIALTAFVAIAAPAHAQTFPSRTIRIIVPYPAGGSIDLTARVIAKNCRTASDIPSSWKTNRAQMPPSASTP